MKISIIVISYNRKEELRKCLVSILNQTYMPEEVIVLDNNSTDGTDELFNSEFTYPFIKFLKLDRNYGVAGGRNIGIGRANGDILVFIDDDAEIKPANAIEKIRQKFDKKSSVGTLAFKILNYYSKTIQREEFPHLDKSLNPDMEFETTYFIGAGHAIRREVFEKCGLYPEDFFYGMEELDLSFRIIEKGFKILYYPEVTVLHKKSPQGRIGDIRKWLFILRNRMIVSYKYLPYRYFLISSLIWFLKVIIKSRSLVPALKGLIQFFRVRNDIIRQPIKKETLKKIKQFKGRIWH